MSQTPKQISDERLGQYMGARYGQSPETEQKYREAVLACVSIMNLSLTVADIARIYKLDPQCLRGQLKRHYPEIIPVRNGLREKLGYAVFDQGRLHKASMERYAPAVKMLERIDLTVKEVAEKCGVPFQGLEQHLLFYHKDIAEQRLGKRVQALTQIVKPEGRDCNNRPVGPSATTQARYADAIEMARTTDLPLTDIARHCGVEPRGLQCHVQKWHRDLMKERRRRRKDKLSRRKESSPPRLSRSEKARELYAPAVKMISGGMTLSEAAASLGVELYNLNSWMKIHHPEVLEKARAGMMKAPSGVVVKRSSYERYKVIADYIAEHPEERTGDVANRFGVPSSSMHKVMARVFPDVWKSHLDACSKDRERQMEEHRESMRQAMREFDSGRISLAEIARRHGISVKTLKWWRSNLVKDVKLAGKQ